MIAKFLVFIVFAASLSVLGFIIGGLLDEHRSVGDNTASGSVPVEVDALDPRLLPIGDGRYELRLTTNEKGWALVVAEDAVAGVSRAIAGRDDSEALRWARLIDADGNSFLSRSEVGDE